MFCHKKPDRFRSGGGTMEDSTNSQSAGGTRICRPPAIESDDRIFLAWQRSHMANERTFLSWSRTSVSLLAFGFVIERFDLFLKYLYRAEGTPTPLHLSGNMIYLSWFSFFLAAFATLVSGIRFLRVRRHINNGEAVYSVVPDILVVISVIVIIIMAAMLSFPHVFSKL
jgi:putative membrane protein